MIVFIAVVALLIVVYQQYANVKQQDKIEQRWSDYTLKLLSQHEREKNNLITAIKSYTAEDYSSNLILPSEKIEIPKEEDNYQDLSQLAEENPEQFDKLVLEDKI